MQDDYQLNFEELGSAEALASTEGNEPDDAESASGSQEAGPEAMAASVDPEFEAFIASLELRYFTAAEFLTKGGSHHSGPCAGKNTDPPKHLWQNIVPTARLMDRLRSELGASIRLTSVYRSLPYNSCLDGTASQSFHMKFNAVDFQTNGKTPLEVANKLMAMRDAGVFRGGVGCYPTFVHVDTRGYNPGRFGGGW